MLLKDIFTAKTNLAVSSTEFCQSIYCEGDIGLGLSSCSSHGAMRPLPSFANMLFALQNYIC
jgi:hypothetical protein